MYEEDDEEAGSDEHKPEHVSLLYAGVPVEEEIFC